jgi:hypothetical protein
MTRQDRDSPSIFSLIGERYLDTQHDPAHIAKVDAELKRRGISGIRRFYCEYLAAAALWWNIFWWVWDSLDERDIRRGWLQNALLFGTVGVTIDLLFGGMAATFFVVALHLITLLVGLDLRRGSCEFQS